jgi:sugar phosphate isomerase/epimerase
MNRRQFISRSATALALGSVAGQHTFAAMTAKLNKGRIGIQLYSVKDELSNDFEGTLKKLSAIGYSAVELYGFTGDKFLNRYTGKELSDIVKDMGMSISGAHTGSGILPEDVNAPEWDFWKKRAEYLRSGGAKWAVQAGYPGAKSVDDLNRIAEHFNRTGEVCKTSGVKFAYHNHDAELGKIDGEVILDFLIRNTDPKLVFFQIDLGHAVNGGGDCVRYLRDFPGRFALWHASDFDAASRTYTDVGKGSVPYPELFDLAKTSGLEVLTVEQETKGDIFASCKVDFDYLKQFKWTKA